MSTRILGLLLLFALCACATTAPVTMPDQPGFVSVAQPYADSFRSLGITSVTSPGSGAMLRLETGYGDVFIRYPAGIQPMAFVVDIDAKGVRVRSESLEHAPFSALFAAFAPEAIRVTTANNSFMWYRANPAQ
jgi:hypothetical protein